MPNVLSGGTGEMNGCPSNLSSAASPQLVVFTRRKPPRPTNWPHLILMQLLRVQVGAHARAQLVQLVPAVPQARAPLDNRHNLLANAVRKLLFARPHRGLPVDGVHQPRPGHAPPRPSAHGHRHLEGLAATGEAREAADADQGRDRVDG